MLILPRSRHPMLEKKQKAPPKKTTYKALERKEVKVENFDLAHFLTSSFFIQNNRQHKCTELFRKHYKKNLLLIHGNNVLFEEPEDKKNWIKKSSYLGQKQGKDKFLIFYLKKERKKP